MGQLSLGWAYGLLFGCLLVFAALVALHELYRSGGSLGALERAVLHPDEDFVSSRAQHGWLALGLSLFASLAGNWLLFLPADVGALYSWPGVIGYALAVSLPYIALKRLSPLVKRLTGEAGFSGTDFLLIRFGRLVQLIFVFVSVSCMFLSFVVELTTIGTTFRAVTGQQFPPAAAIVPLALITLLYTLYGGLRTSIFTDKYQGCLIVLLAIPVVVAVFATSDSGDAKWWMVSAAPTSTGGCFIAGAVLVLSLWPVFLLDQGIWQRVWAAKSQRDLDLALLLAAVLAFSSVLLFGVSGMACRRAADVSQGGIGTFSVFAFLAENLTEHWLAVITVLAVACVASSVDTYQIALASVFMYDLKSAKLSYNWARLALLLGNAAAIAMACAQLSILTLCMASNMMCVVVSGSLLASVAPNITAVGLLCGITAAFFTALACGVISTRSFVKGLEFFAPADFSSLAYVIAFILLPIVGIFIAVACSKLHRCLRPASLRALADPHRAKSKTDSTEALPVTQELRRASSCAVSERDNRETI